MVTRYTEGLEAREQALVAVAVLLDGFEASVFLETDAEKGELMTALASHLASQPPELRLPYVGTLLRRALKIVEEESQ